MMSVVTREYFPEEGYGEDLHFQSNQGPWLDSIPDDVACQI
jgi:hypothetical protein